MIKSIKLKNFATYSSEGSSIENCKKINFIYGPNGSGKTTISNFLQNPLEPQYSDCEIEWETNSAVDVIVYNREFREKNFKGDIAGVFTLGQATIEEIKAIEAMKRQQSDLNKELIAAENTLNKKKEEEKKEKNMFRDAVWEAVLKQNEGDFQEAFTGFRGNKEKFRDEVISRFNACHISNNSRESLVSRSKTLFAKKQEKYDLIDFPINTIAERIDAIENDKIWSKTVVGNEDIPISKLIKFLDNADWVNRGRQYIQNNGVCPFCQQQTISADIENQLNSFFSGEYEQNVQYIKKLIDEYNNLTNDMIRIMNATQKNSSLGSIGGIDMDKFTSSIDVLIERFSSNTTQMKDKEKEPGKTIRLNESNLMIEIIKEMITQANDAIAINNKMVNNYNTEKTLLVDDIWAFLMNEQKALIEGYLKKLSDLQKGENGIQKKINDCKYRLVELGTQIIEAGKNITSVQPTVDEINRSLKAYGFTNFKIVPSEHQTNSYQIQRMDGTLATDTLSEGEETFISFLYFLQFAKGSVDVSKVSSRKILVLDDPICSLDSTVLYIVSSMVKGLIKEIRESHSDVDQIFILTHNVFFHKETSFVDKRMDTCDDINYWIIRKDDNISSIKSYGKYNPIKTSYELLWQELKSSDNTSLVTIQNVMRRILENYFSILGKEKDDTIVEFFDTIEEKMICRSLLSWINDGSHSIPDDLYIDSYTDSIERYKQIFKTIFVKMGHEEHYKMMMNNNSHHI